MGDALSLHDAAPLPEAPGGLTLARIEVSAPDTTTAAGRLHEMATAYWTSQCLSVAARLGVADLLAPGSRSIEELARATATDADRLRRLLRALASVGVLAESGEDGFRLAALGEPMRSDHPGSLRSLIAMCGEESFAMWGGLMDMMRGGPPSFERMFGARFYDYLADHPDAAETFDRAIAERHAAVQPELVRALGLDGVEAVVDVGGGEGRLAIELLQAHPRLRVTLAERPDVAARAARAIAAAGLAERAECVPADFFERLPHGHDAYLVASVLHNWDDAEATRILEVCREAMAPASRLLVVEMLVPPGDTPSFAKLLDINVMLLMGGRERTEHELVGLAEGAGLRVTGLRATGGRMTIAEMSRVG